MRPARGKNIVMSHYEMSSLFGTENATKEYLYESCRTESYRNGWGCVRKQKILGKVSQSDL